MTIKLKSYCQAQGKKPFDWNRFLQKKHYTSAELVKATRLAGEWVTCACGNQCAIIPRLKRLNRWTNGGQPIDTDLCLYGREFYEAIQTLAYGRVMGFSLKWPRIKACAILCRIEKRAAVLVKMELARPRPTVTT